MNLIDSQCKVDNFMVYEQNKLAPVELSMSKNIAKVISK